MGNWKVHAGICFGLLMLAGCGGGGKEKVYPAEGKLTLDGKPFGPAIIVFEPTTPPVKGEETRKTPGGKADASGVITVTTYTEGDGAPAGEYRVYLPPDPMNPTQPLPQLYQDPKTSGLTVKIEEKSGEEVNDFTVDLKSDAGPLARTPGGGAATGIDPSLMPKTSP